MEVHGYLSDDSVSEFVWLPKTEIKLLNRSTGTHTEPGDPINRLAYNRPRKKFSQKLEMEAIVLHQELVVFLSQIHPASTK